MWDRTICTVLQRFDCLYKQTCSRALKDVSLGVFIYPATWQFWRRPHVGCWTCLWLSAQAAWQYHLWSFLSNTFCPGPSLDQLNKSSGVGSTCHILKLSREAFNAGLAPSGKPWGKRGTEKEGWEERAPFCLLQAPSLLPASSAWTLMYTQITWASCWNADSDSDLWLGPEILEHAPVTQNSVLTWSEADFQGQCGPLPWIHPPKNELHPQRALRLIWVVAKGSLWGAWMELVYRSPSQGKMEAGWEERWSRPCAGGIQLYSCSGPHQC